MRVAGDVGKIADRRRVQQMRRFTCAFSGIHGGVGRRIDDPLRRMGSYYATHFVRVGDVQIRVRERDRDGPRGGRGAERSPDLARSSRYQHFHGKQSASRSRPARASRPDSIGVTPSGIGQSIASAGSRQLIERSCSG